MNVITLLFALGCVPILAASDKELLWKDPGQVERLDLATGPGGRSYIPKPPYTFLKEDASGSYPKVLVKDARGRHWSVKFGREVRAEPFGARMAWAAGYYAEPDHFVQSGIILGVHDLKRAAKSISTDGSFHEARFQLRDPAVKFSDNLNWSWVNNPFQDTHEMNGLKILMMLVSNWDNKDARDQDEGVNTAIFEQGKGRETRYTYAFSDWGGIMGHWGNAIRRSVWNCGDFAADTPQFIKGVDHGIVEWGYRGRHDADFQKNIRVEDVAWLMRTIGRLRDAQIRSALNASGATPTEVDCFTGELRRRIDRLREVATSGRPLSHAVGTKSRPR